MFQEFKEFAMKGNLVDMAVGFVMGTAFATVVTAFIQGVFLPALSPVLGGLDFGSWKYVLEPAGVAEDGSEIAEVAIKIGEFISATISFLIVAFVMFLIIKGMNRAMKAMEEEKEPEPEAPKGPTQEELLVEIRDLLAKSS
ncbi:MAG: large conductance mechanosensitive channel protein MscL [Pseudomonadota bacterium]